MKLLLLLVLTIEISIAWAISFRLRLCKKRFSALEFFIIAHYPLIALGSYTCTWYYSWATPEDAWILAFYTPIELGFVLLGVWYMRGRTPVKAPEDRIQLHQTDKRVLHTCLTCLVLTMIGFWGLSYDSRSFSELLTLNRVDRWTSSLDAVSFKQLNQLLIVPVVVSFGMFFIKGGGYKKLVTTVFLVSSTAFGLSCLIALSRGRLVQAMLACMVITWVLGDRKARKGVVAFTLISVFVFVPFSVALWKYRDSMDIHEAIDTVVSMEWTQKALEDPTFECNDICLAVLDEYKDPRTWRYLEGVAPLALFFVPRKIWTEKPVVFGPLVWRNVLMGGGEKIGVGPTFIGEAYSIAGPWGIIVCSFILGALFVLYEFLCYRFLYPWESLAMIAVILMPAATVVRGDFHSAFIMRFVVYPMAFFASSMGARFLIHFITKSSMKQLSEQP